MKTKSFAAALALLAPSLASAQDSNWYFHLGAAHVGFSESATLSSPAGVIPGANATLGDNSSLALGVGYRFAEDFSVIGILGIPPTTTINGSGALAGVEVGDVKYGPSVVALNYHIPTKGAFQPFIGVGVSYTKIFESTDSGLTNLEVDDTFGAVLRVGFDYMITERDGLFLSANKIFASTKASGNATALGGAPVTADIDLDPLIIHAGWSRRF